MLREVQTVGAVGVLGVGPDRLVDGVGVVADEDPPRAGADAVEDDRRRLRRRERRVVAEHLAERLDQAAEVLVGDVLDRQAATSQVGADGVEVGFEVAVDAPAVDDDVGADVAGHDDGHLHVRGVDPEVLEQRLGEALHGELRRAVGGVRDAGTERCPETVHAAGVDEVAVVAGDEQRDEGPCAVVDAAPADRERLVPLRRAAR